MSEVPKSATPFYMITVSYTVDLEKRVMYLSAPRIISRDRDLDEKTSTYRLTRVFDADCILPSKDTYYAILKRKGILRHTDADTTEHVVSLWCINPHSPNQFSELVASSTFLREGVFK